MRKLIIVISIIIFIWGCNRSSKGYEHECSDEIGCLVIPPDNPVKIGIIQDLSGSASVFGNMQLRAILLALENRGKTFLGHNIETIVEDEACTEEGGKNAAIRITSMDGVVGVIGTTCSSGASKASKIISDAGFVLISGSNSAASLTAVGSKKGDLWNEGYFRTATNDSYRGKAAADFAFNNLGARKVVTIDDGDQFTKGSVEIFIQEFEELGGEIIFTGRVDKGDKNMDPLLKSISRIKPDLVYAPLFASEGISIINHLRNFPELKKAKIMSTRSMIVDSFLANLEDGDPAIYYSGSVSPEGEKLEDVLKQYIEKYNESPTGSFSAGYDAVNILFSTIEKVSFKDKKGTLYIPRKKLRDELYKIRDFNGITGKLSCTEFGDLGLNKFNIYKVETGLGGYQQSRVVHVFKQNK